MTLLIIFKKKMSVGENEQTLERCGLLVGMLTGASENSEGVPQTLKKRGLPWWSSG